MTFFLLQDGPNQEQRCPGTAQEHLLQFLLYAFPFSLKSALYFSTLLTWV